MADRNRNRSSYASNENWDQNQSRYGREGDYNQSNYGNVNYDRENEWNRTSGYGSNYGSSQGGDYGNAGYGRGSENEYGQGMGRQDYGSYGSSNYGSSFGSSGYGRREGDWGGQSRNTSGNWGSQSSRGDQNYEGYGGRSGSMGSGYRSEHGREDIGDYGQMGNRGYGGNEQFGRQRMSSQRGGMYGQTGNMYGGDTRNYGNANQGGYDRGWWDRTRDEVSSWFGDDDAERRRRMDKQDVGEHRGKGPRGYHRSDERIREDVCDRLSDNAMIDASDIEIKVSNAEVVLSGRVDSRDDKRRAEDIAESVSGVSNVQNQLRVGREEMASSTGRTGSSSTTTGTERKSSRNE